MSEALKVRQTPGATPENPGSAPLLEVEGFSVSFTQYERGLHQRTLTVISDLHIEIGAGEVLAVVGASGSGKSLLAHAILGILPANASVGGSIRFDGAQLDGERQAALRGKEMALVPQSVNFLDPLMRAGKQVLSGRRKAEDEQKLLFSRYGLKAQTDRLFPFQLSGGMARRVLLAAATASGARLLIADEPTPGLDRASLQEALAHLRQLADRGCGVLLISHDIEAALSIADRVAVFYAGTTVEVAPGTSFCGDGELLLHPYSRSLWQALPQNGFAVLPGLPPAPDSLPPGCLFAPRCYLAEPECGEWAPVVRRFQDGMVRCHVA